MESTESTMNLMKETLICRLREWEQKSPDKIALRYCDGNGEEIAKMTYRELNRTTYKIAMELREKYKLEEGSCVMLVYPPCIDFALVFISCLRAGLVAVPVYPPNPKGIKKNVNLFSGIQSNCQAKVALCNGDFIKMKKLTSMKNFFSMNGVHWPDLEWINTDSILQKTTLPEVPEDEPALHFKPDQLCFLQYTSGSTSLPKGVMISWSSLTTNIQTIIHSLKAGPHAVVVSWLPQYHDMGLIGSLLSLLYCGGSGTYMSPIAFIVNPCMWLVLCSKYKATHIQGPNFAYALVLRRFSSFKVTPSFNLSSLQHIFNAAEPISVEVAKQFIKTFSAYGLSREAMTGGYGLAESCVYVSDDGHGVLTIDRDAFEKENHVIPLSYYNCITDTTEDYQKEAKHTISLFSCGNTVKNENTTIKIVKEGKDLGENEVGEVYIASPSLARGYYPSNTEPFQKHIEGDEKLYLETGDLGFIVNKQLYICGRIKDLIIIHGKNHYPQDIEYSCHSIPQVKQGSIAAFTVINEEEEKLIVALEIREGSYSNEDYETICKECKKKISQDNGIAPVEILILGYKTIPKTTSGKISRSRVKDEYMNHKLTILYSLKSNTNELLTEEEIKETTIDPLEIETPSSSSKPSDVLPPINEEAAINPLDTADLNLPSIQDGIKTCEIHGEELENALLEDVCYLCGIQSYSVSITDSLEMMGLDSLKRAQLNSILEQYYGATVTPEFLFDVNTTFEQLLNTIDVIKQKDRKPIIRTIDMSAVEEGEEPVPQRPVYSPPERTFCQKFCCQIR